MSAIDLVLDRLGHVRQTSPDAWMARCPAHKDRSPSLSIRARDDGKVLLNCFAGCMVGEVVQSLGLTLSDLFPPRADRYRPHSERWQGPSPSAALSALAFDITFAAIIVNDLAAGKPIEEDDRARLWTAVGRINQARALGNG